MSVCFSLVRWYHKSYMMFTNILNEIKVSTRENAVNIPATIPRRHDFEQ